MLIIPAFQASASHFQAHAARLSLSDLLVIASPPRRELSESSHNMQSLNASLLSCLDGLGCINIFNQFLPGALGEDVLIEGRRFRIIKLVSRGVRVLQPFFSQPKLVRVKARRRRILLCVPCPGGGNRREFIHHNHTLCVEEGKPFRPRCYLQSPVANGQKHA